MIYTDIKIALHNLSGSKARSLLTMLGIIIGVASVLAIVSLGDGVKHQINDQIGGLGQDFVTIMPGNTVSRDQNGHISGFNFSGGSAISTLDEKDLQTVQSTPGVAYAAGRMVVSGSVSSRHSAIENTEILGVSPQFLRTTALKLAEGQFFDSVDNNQSVVLGSDIAKQLFGADDPIAQTLSVRGQQFIVIGVLNPPSSSNLLGGQSGDDSIYIPLDEAKQFNQGVIQLQTIDFRVTNVSSIDQTTNSVKSALIKNHKGQQDFSIIKQDEILSASNNVFKILTTFIAAIASISLLVGGIGIMNVMIAGVTERTREIGIRKSVGATNGQIWTQFLTEAAILSLVGGIIGILLAMVATYSLKSRTNITPMFTWQTVLLAAGISILVGIIFGVTPAIQAARKDPIESLRYE